MGSRSNRILYVGNLPVDFRERDIEDIFHKYGPVVKIDLKFPPRPPGYCFIEFENARDAEDAIRGRDGYDIDGHRLRVELAHGGRGALSVDRYSSFSSGGGRRNGRLQSHCDYRVTISGLPSSASWQDLKDHMRRAGDVTFAQVFRDSNDSPDFPYIVNHLIFLPVKKHKNDNNVEKKKLDDSFQYSQGTTGVVDYTNYDDMKYAIRKLDDTEFKNPFSRSYIRVKEYGSKGSMSRSRSRSFSRSRSRSRSHSHSRTRSPSRSPNVSRRKVHSKPLRSRSRSGSMQRPRSKPVPRTKSRSRSRTPRHKSGSPRSRSRSYSPSRSRSAAAKSG